MCMFICVCLCVYGHMCVISLTRPPVTSVCFHVWGQTAVSSTPYIRLAIKTCLGPTLLHTLSANERCTISRTMKPLTTFSGVAWVIKKGGGGGGCWGQFDPLQEVYYHFSCRVRATSILLVSRQMVNAQAHFPGEKRFCTETRALLANFTDISQKLRRTFLCCSGVSGD